ncbi:MAG: peptidoglycan DD-metalloendopeptidase family protein [Oleiphilaceae bacterium]|nr:peptidoglycan DD-metalloendopeptidase family protein [Oleiphilaceae bacterium]
MAALFFTGAAVTATAIFSSSGNVEAKRLSIALDLESGETSQAISTPREDSTPVKLAEAKGRQQAESSSEPAASQIAMVTDNAGPNEAASPTAKTAAQPKADLATPPGKTEAAEPELSWAEFPVRNGDSLSTLFKKAGFSAGLMLSIVNGDGDAKNLERLYAGETISFATDQNGDLAAIELQRSLRESLEIERRENSFVGKKVLREPEIRTKFAQAEINSSLFWAAQQAGMTDKMTMELAGIFGWDIDFALDIRKGDYFSVVYEELFLDGEKIDNGRILSASFHNRGKALTAVLYTNQEGKSDYYSPDGRSMRKAFLRTPVDFARISSSFNLKRRHPVLNTIRAHKGTDYAAQTGTPIKAAGDGKVIHAGRKGGYGNTVVLQHGNNITTLYAHMSKLAKNAHTGRYVKQGQVIGYIGATGLATGPHLHYEFRVNGSHRNPATVKLPDAAPVPKAQLAHFKSATETMLAQLTTYQDTRRITLARGGD